MAAVLMFGVLVTVISRTGAGGKGGGSDAGCGVGEG